MGRLENLIVHTQRALPVLLGAGASVSAGAGTGLRIARDLKGLLDDGQLADQGQRGNLLQEFEETMASLGGGFSASGLHLQRYLQGLLPTSGHRALARLVRRGLVGPAILTTNFDSLVENALQDEGVKFDRYIPGLDDEEGLDHEHEGVLVVKLHGDASSPHTLRFRPEQVQRFPAALEHWLVALVRARGLLVAGHRLRDPDLLKVLHAAAPTQVFLGLVDPAGLTEGSAAVLAAHGSRDNLANRDFDRFFLRLDRRLTRRDLYAALNEQLEQAWRQLDHVRFAGGSLGALQETVKALPPDLAECDALRLLAAHQEGRGRAPNLSSEALRWLDFAFEHRQDRDLPSRLRLASRLVFESMLALLAGEELWAGEHERHPDPLQGLIERGEGELALPGAERRPAELAGLEAALGEAYKELYTRRSLLDDQAGAARKLQRAGTLLKQALDRLPASESVPLDFQAVLLRTFCERHLAVVEEYAGALAVDPLERIGHYRAWLQRSQHAVRLAAAVGEHRLRAYASMNVAAAVISVFMAERGPRLGPEPLEEAKKALELAKEHMHAVADDRGLAWCSLHSARLLARRIAVGEGEGEGERAKEHHLRLYAELEAEALSARTWGRRAGNDAVAIGLANLYAAFANLERAKATFHGTEFRDTIIALKAAIRYSSSSLPELAASHRLPQAARAAQIRAEATVMLARLEPDKDASASVSDAIRLQAEAICMLARLHTVDMSDLQRHFSDLNATIEHSVPRIFF